MKKYLLFVLLVFSFVLLGCGDDSIYKESTPKDGLLTNKLSVEEMKYDLDYYVDYVKNNHAKYDHSLSKEEFDNEIKRIENNLENYTSDQFVFELVKLTAKIGDGNTYTNLDSTRTVNRNYLPFEARLFEEGYIITDIEETHKAYIGYKLTEINGVDIEEVVNKLCDYTSGDTYAGKKYNAVNNINFWDMLYNAGIVSSKEVELTISNGTDEYKVTVKAYINKKYSEVKFATDEVELYSDYNKLYYSYSLEDRVLYIQYNYCGDMSSKSMKAFAEELKSYAKINIHKNIVLDLRHNNGGYQETIAPLFSLLRDFNREGGKVYVLIGSGTKGVAIINAMQLSNEGVGVLIGEPTGGLNNFYGTRKTVKLPKSLLSVTIATQYQEYFKGEEGVSLIPGDNVVQTYADYINGVDSAIKFALK